MKLLLVLLAMVFITACSTTENSELTESQKQAKDKKFNRSQFRVE
jgi:hypothetical protein